MSLKKSGKVYLKKNYRSSKNKLKMTDYFLASQSKLHNEVMHSLGYTFSAGATEKKQKHKSLRDLTCAILPPEIQRRNQK